MGRPKKVVEAEEDNSSATPFNLKDFVKHLSKETDDEADIQLMGSGENTGFTVPYWINTGLVGLDWVLGGGIPGGRLIEVFSNNPSEGKTSLVSYMAAATQKAGGLALLIDTESGSMVDRIAELGVNVDDLIISQPEHMEKVFSTIDIFIKSAREDGFTGPLVIFWDSVAATPTKSELEAEYDKQLYAPKARVLSSGICKLMPTLREHDATLVCANQVREDIGVTFGEQNKTVGGKGLKFYAHIRLGLSKTGTIKDSNNNITGLEIQVTAKKNKLTRPFKKTDLKLHFDKSFDGMDNEFQFGLTKGLIVENGKGFYSLTDNGTVKFRAGAYEEHRTEELANKLKELVKK